MVRALAGRIAAESRGRVQMIGVGQAPSGAVRDYAREHGFEFPVAAVEDRRTLMLFRGRTVPLVMVIGAVRHWHFGTLDTREQVDTILAGDAAHGGSGDIPAFAAVDEALIRRRESSRRLSRRWRGGRHDISLQFGRRHDA